MKERLPILTQSVLTTLLALVSLVVFAVLVTTYEPVATDTTPNEVLNTNETQASENKQFIEMPDTKHSEQQSSEQKKKEEHETPIAANTLQGHPDSVPTQQPESEQTTTISVPTDLYTTPPMSLDTVNQMTLPALVNILCGTRPNSGVAGATGSGIIIDPRGVILTNAHVAQYVLLAQHPDVQAQCVVRTGQPAQARYETSVLAFPKQWLENHAQDLIEELPKGTGEHDWALLYISGTVDSSKKPETFPFVQADVREGIVVTNDPVLLSSYPAGFLGSIALRRDLWPVSTTVSIQKVYTFSEQLVDLLALGGNIIAQGGSSGGAVMNPWGKLVGIIVTSSLGDTTDQRDLRAVTLSHIDRSMLSEHGVDLATFLSQGDFVTRTQLFRTEEIPSLLEYFPL